MPTNQQGGAVARHLLKNGWRIRALTRDPNKLEALALRDRGAEISQADNEDRASLDAAFDGVYGVFSVQAFWTNGIPSEIRQGKTIADAAKSAGVKHFVYSSVGGAERDSGVPHFESKWEIEGYIHELGLSATILRPVEFMENYFWMRPAVLNGMLFSQGLRSERKKYFIAVDDIGAFATSAFENPQEYIGTSIEIAGDALTEAEIAATFTKVIGRPVQLVQPPNNPEQPLDEELQLMIRWFDEHGYQSDIANLRNIYPPLQTLETWLRRTGWENAEPIPETESAWTE